jgi:WD40 repeat protein
MNKDLFDGLPADEKPVAAKLNSISENMKVPQNFQWTLESQLMDAYQNKSQPAKGSFAKIIVPVAWTLIAVLGFFLLNWTISSLVPPEQVNPATSNTEIHVENFESKVRQGRICEGPLAVARGFSVSLTNGDKTAFDPLDEEKAIGELRSFSWSPDGSRLALVGNTRGSGNIYLTDSTGSSLQPVLSESPLGYLMDVAWSRDGKQLLTWSVQNNTIVYLVNADGSNLKEMKLGMYMIGTPQFAPDNKSIIFPGSNTSSYGLFEVTLNDLQIRQISKFVEDVSGFAFSPDGTQLAYMDMDRISGGAVLMMQDVETWAVTPLPDGLPIPKGSGSSIPDVANLSWSQDGTKLVFEFGRNAANRAVYLVHADGSGQVKVLDSAYAPTISADGNCLGYISNKKVFIINLNDVTLSSNSSTPMLVADLPSGTGTGDFRLNKLQWRP